MMGASARHLVAWGVAIALFAGFSSALAKEAKPLTPEELQNIRSIQSACLKCHSETGIAKLEKKEFEYEQMQGLFVDQTVYEASSHGLVDCLACHVTGYKEYPHFEQGKSIINNCDECHTREFLYIEEQYMESVHHKQMTTKIACDSCHDPHVFLKASKFKTVGEAVAQDNAMCAQCHGITSSLATLGRGRQEDLEKNHEWLPNLKAHWTKVRCVDCHTAPWKKQLLSHNIMGAKGALRDCVACHTVDSALRLRQYAHLVGQEREKLGFINSVILNEAYVVGATRNRYLDLAFGGITLLVVAGIGVHTLARIIAYRRRSRRHD
ncbi:cytochrome c3 family protein [Magnetospira sp. QH-2]|uniref:cytochrome c3 family protein n=1 Tax=Magnetospira sp. (strain QH-2) TaxID=1288970 RepID=UPI0003E80C90|nr:cytochrome c3 family protein [Magnetospira sp. QH-2]CCQ73593.1 Conserved exported protein of unknown function [Magnetospira sp. QH-2]